MSWKLFGLVCGQALRLDLAAGQGVVTENALFISRNDVTREEGTGQGGPIVRSSQKKGGEPGCPGSPPSFSSLCSS